MGHSETIYHHQILSVGIEVTPKSFICAGHRRSVMVFDSLAKTVH
jgi:hypothetical protein